MIVWLASYPRSGNGFFRVISRQRFKLQTFSVYQELGHYLNKNQILDYARNENSILVKTHDLPSDENPAIYLVRDGRDSVVSYAHWTLSKETNEQSIDPQSREFKNRLRNIITTSKYFGGWSAHVLAWHKRPNTHIIRFEDLITQPIEVVAGALNFANLPYSFNAETRLVKFETLHAKDPVHYRKGVAGNWQTDMSSEMQKLFWRNCGPAMNLLGYS
jgi:hypothetical protein